MLDTNYSVDILINNKPIRKFPFNDKLFIEARKGQEYSIRIENNTFSRILAVTSVDGLDTLTGKQAEENGNGYVINGYNSLTIDGFRVSNEKVAKFIFDYKESSYAASKKDGSEKNVGVVGVRLFQEKVKPIPTVIYNHPYYNYWWNSPYRTSGGWYDSYTTSCGCSGSTLDMSIDYSCTDEPTPNPNHYKCSATLSGNSAFRGQIKTMTSNISNCCDNPMEVERGFDMGTKFGQAKQSKVVEVEFEKGILVLTTDIYYASRQSLIEMGVPITNEKQVSFPEPFKDSKYSTPPKGWKG
jgi:hypothetical protein